jgi:TRAP-type uncharacterized transport system substrate-binding protein
MHPDPLPRPRRWRLREAIIGAGAATVALLLLLLAGLLFGAYKVLDPTPDKRLVIATGPEKGAYIEFAKRYLPVLQEHGIKVELRATQGSRENLALLRDPASGVQAAFVQGGVDSASAASGAPAVDDAVPLVSLGNVAYEPLWLFYRVENARRHLGDVPLTRLAQLNGWRINTGPVGGGSGPLFTQLTEANGLTTAQMELLAKPGVLGVVDLVQGHIDALVMVSAAEAPLVQYLLHSPGVSLFDVQQAEAYARRFPFLRALTLPRGVVDLAADEPPQDVRMVAATASLVVREDLHPALVQLLLQGARQAHGDAGWFARAREFPNPVSAEFPLSPEAERFYRSGPPWLQRYLPFWLANFIDRMWIVVLPLLALLVPLSRLLPPLVELRVRSRVFRWYANLRAVERDIARDARAEGAKTAAATQARHRDLDRIEAQVERVGVPLAYAHEVYALRGHIQLVRKRLAGTAVSGSPAQGTADTPPAP